MSCHVMQEKKKEKKDIYIQYKYNTIQYNTI